MEVNMTTSRRTIPSYTTGPIKLAVMESSRDFGSLVYSYLAPLIGKTGESDTFLLSCSCPRFGSGEGKGIIYETVRGCDLFILTDVTNSSLTYSLNQEKVVMSPDDHYQDLKRIIEATNGKAKRINVIIPFLYEGRQHRRSMRESLDCAIMLQELVSMGVSSIITFDAHDPRMQNAIPFNPFDSFMPTYQFLKALVGSVPDLSFDQDHMMVISPDEGATERCFYLANVLGLGMGVFYKRRDYSKVVNGKNPIIAHEFLGETVQDKDVLIIDDIISSGESIMDVSKQLHRRGAKRVFICTTFGLFSEGLEKFDALYEAGVISKVVTTNLNYRSEALLSREWYLEADMSEYLAHIIYSLHNDLSIRDLQEPTEKINELMRDKKDREA